MQPFHLLAPAKRECTASLEEMELLAFIIFPLEQRAGNSGWELKAGLEWAGPGVFKTIVALCVEVELAFWDRGGPHHC